MSNARQITEEERDKTMEIIRIVQDMNSVSRDTYSQQLNLLKASIDETNHLAKKTHRILVGDPEIKRKGLVEMVDSHERIVVKGGAIFCTVYACWEVFKATVLKSH
jgi:hypothetical protein